ncbi:MAG: phosphoesterase PA-phosphatase [Austwickia sp.]|jgi:membrane-associated phospholipid phosphatase|nr:MAG: phosphoesterase PA-phosphatase [Austwickia sp.]
MVAREPSPPAVPPEEDHPDLVRLAAARPSRLARAISEATDPALVVAAVTTYVAVRSSGGWLSGLGWAGLAVLFCVALPYGVLFVLLRGGVVADRHVVRREQRLWPSLTALVSVLVGLGLLWRLGAPWPLIVLVLSQLAGLVAISLVTLWSKASLHTAVTAGALCVVALLQGGAWWAIAALCAAIVGWARIRGGRHSPPQVVAGLLIGAATTIGVFGPLALAG